MSCTEAENLKSQGNEFLKLKDYDKAIESYTKAIELCPDNYLYRSNRAAAYASLGRYEESLHDAEKTIELNPSWGKGYSRLGAALEYLGRVDEAKKAYERGLAVDPTNSQLRSSLDALASSNVPEGNYNNIFQQLMSDPKMRELFNDPEFMQKMSTMNNNPDALLRDPKFMNAFSNILSQKGGAAGNPQQHHDEPGCCSKSPKDDPCCQRSSDSSCSKEKSNESTRSEASKADELKELGNAAYKARDFEKAIDYYKKAKESNPETIVYDLNISAVLFEQQKFDECIKMCEEAVEEGRSRREPFKLIARALARIGNVYTKLENYQQAVKYYEKSLSEFRDQEIVKKVKSIQKIIADEEAKKLINPEMAEEERQKGNTAFSEGRFAESIQHYTESIKRNPDDAKTYSNRAAAYTKLMEYNLCIQDCNKSISLDPKFVKSYLRKANALLMIKDPLQAKTIYEKAVDLDPYNQEARAGLRKAAEAVNQLKPEEAADSAMRDPEVQEILSDPSMRAVLETMQNDPASCANYFRDPTIAKKIEKLVSAGIVKLGAQ